MKKPTAKHKFHFFRLSLFLILGIAVLLTQTDGGQSLQLTYNKQVLAYSTNMSAGDLLAAANASRAASGLAPLALNSQLNNSAQMKANDMIAKNYWSHVSPNGTQPWYWFQQAGYGYSAAGENLAYGFNTGQEVNTGWMNSPTHRDNILGNYTDVGFGIASGASYQGSENTVVVAHYGKPLVAPTPAPVTPTPTPTPTPTTPAPTPTPAPSPTITPQSQPTPTAQEATPTPVAESTPAETELTPEAGSPKNEEIATTPVKTDEKSESVSALDQLKNHQAPVFVAAGLGLIGAASLGYAVTHRVFMKKLVRDGQRFAMRHPLFDIVAVCIAIALILNTTVGKLL